MKVKPAKALWDLLALSGSEILGKIAGFVAFATLARIFSPSDYGAIELAVSLFAFFASVVDFGLGPIGSTGGDSLSTQSGILCFIDSSHSDSAGSTCSSSDGGHRFGDVCTFCNCTVGTLYFAGTICDAIQSAMVVSGFRAA